MFRNSNESLSAGEASWEDYRSTPFFKNLKKQMEGDSWHPGCLSCKHNEDLKINSMRLVRNTEMTGLGDKLEYMDLTIDTHCNLSCKSCNTSLSSKWEKIVKDNPEIKDIKFNNSQNINRSISNLITTIDLTNLRRLKIQGGEPFLSKKFKPLIETIANNPSMEELFVITNSTFFPETYIPIMAKFKKIDILLSIDGIGQVNDYLRVGSSWKRVSSTAEKWSVLQQANPNFKVEVNFTLSSLNIHNYILVKEWAKSLNFNCNLNVLHFPEVLSINSLPDSYIVFLKNAGFLNDLKLARLIRNRTPTNPTKLKQYILSLDLAQKTNAKISLPELASHLNYQFIPIINS
jgi:sulfatase maturation enzyme AslB (radical SAM superfamily)